MTRVHPLRADESPSEAVYSVVAELEGRSALELPPLGETVEPTALDDLVASGAGTMEVRFEYCDYAVTVVSDEVRIGPTDG